METTITIGHSLEQQSEIYRKVKRIINRGNIVVFTNRLNGIIKYVNEWNMDEMGDLTAFYSTGRSNFVCPVALEYEISEMKAKNCLTIGRKTVK